MHARQEAPVYSISPLDIVIDCSVYANCQLQAYSSSSSSRSSMIWLLSDCGWCRKTGSVFSFTPPRPYLLVMIIYRIISVRQLLRDDHCVAHNLCIHRDDTFPILFSSKLLVTTLQNTVDKTMPCFNLFFWDMRPHLVILLMKLLKLRAWSRWEKKNQNIFLKKHSA